MLVEQVVCQNEYDRLEHVVVVPPKFMRIGKVINETQKLYKEDNIDINKATEQHQQFVSVLEREGVNVIKLDPDPSLNEQVFTRDIGFTIGDKVIIAAMASKVRAEETKYLIEKLDDYQIPYQEQRSSSIEGGDVLIDNNKIWVGISDRTTQEAIDHLKLELPNYQIESITLTEGILHLDCTFNIVSPDLALIYQAGMVKSDYQKLKSTYQLIHVDDEEQFTLGTNVLSIGEQKVISLPENKEVNHALRERGFKVIEVPFNEIIKSGGSFRCCTMPITRL
ncbi:dimethylarginine dimethylaminohydrolase family protein [Amphibacillus sediminis]|uniref:dimethylarginine dimethylaminohydrolase family protein n=1 Tax=Amphibacillus sediminis TaxID=360185 RepID=UPI00082B6C31|nr:arginine deiminase family protein [Amphibacillus sediminis]